MLEEEAVLTASASELPGVGDHLGKFAAMRSIESRVCVDPSE